MAKKSNKAMNIDLSATRKKSFTIDGDENRVIYLNTADVNIISRLKEVYGKLGSMSTEANNIATSDDIDETIVKLKQLDTEMRSLIDYIFDSEVSDICAPDGSMYDLFNGEFRFEHILSALLDLYETNIDKEFNAMKARVNKHTDKYIKK